mgnify:CR=1 FL=1
MSFRIRFHLKNGPNFMHWQITDISTGVKSYVDPSNCNLLMHDCKLHNRKGVALSILKGGEKNVCAWVSCKSFELIKKDRELQCFQIGYNPRQIPHWHYKYGPLINIDNHHFDQIFSRGSELFTVKMGDK